MAFVCAAPALDLGYLLNVMHHKRPLNWEAVLKSDVPLKVVASCLDTLQPIILEDFTCPEVCPSCFESALTLFQIICALASPPCHGNLHFLVSCTEKSSWVLLKWRNIHAAPLDELWEGELVGGAIVLVVAVDVSHADSA